MTTQLTPEQIAIATQITNDRGAAHSPSYTFIKVQPSNSDQQCILTVDSNGELVIGKANTFRNWLVNYEVYRQAINLACDDVEKDLNRGH